MARRFIVIGLLCSVFAVLRSAGADTGWKPLFNGKNLDGWHTVIGRDGHPDTNHLVQIENGTIHMYKDEPEAKSEPPGYILTDKDYSDYHLRLQYKWGTKRFAPRAKTRRDAGILYHVVGKDGVWPRSIECQIQENDVGDVFTVYTRVTASADPKTTNRVAIVSTNANGKVETNMSIQPHFLAAEKGGVAFVQGVDEGIRRVIRNPMNEHEGWNTVEVIVKGDSATYIVNGVTNNQLTHLEEKRKGQWIPLSKGKIALQLEFAEVFYRNVEIKEPSDEPALKP